MSDNITSSLPTPSAPSILNTLKNWTKSPDFPADNILTTTPTFVPEFLGSFHFPQPLPKEGDTATHLHNGSTAKIIAIHPRADGRVYAILELDKGCVLPSENWTYKSPPTENKPPDLRP